MLSPSASLSESHLLKRSHTINYSDHKPARKAVRSFLFMGFCMSLSVGSAIALLDLASTTLGDKVGGAVNGALYGAYFLTALLASGSFVSFFGSKWSLIFASVLYCSYSLSFTISYLFPDIRWWSAMIGGALGGIASGNLWTAQGVYLGEVVRIVSATYEEDPALTSTRLCGYFATEFLACEVICKLLSSLLYYWGGDHLVWATFLIVSGCAAIGMLFVWDTGMQQASGEDSACSVDKASLTIKLLIRDPRMLRLYPSIMSFSVMSVLLNGYVNNHIVKQSIGKIYVGYLGVCVAGTASLVSPLFSCIIPHIGKGRSLIIGQCAFMCAALIVLFCPKSTLGNIPPLFGLFALHGIGRATYEGPLRSMFTDIWPRRNELPYAFANIMVANGISTSICYFFLWQFTGQILCIIVIVLAAFAMVGYFTIPLRKFTISSPRKKTMNSIPAKYLVSSDNLFAGGTEN